MQTLWQDLRYGARMLWKAPGFTAIAILSLALGIGANTALFSLTDAVLLRLLPIKEPGQLALFEWRSGKNFRTGGMRGTFISTEPGTRGASIFQPDTVARLRAEQARLQTNSSGSPLESLFVHAPLWEMTAVYQQQAQVIKGQIVSGNYYAGMKVSAVIGRTIMESDDDATATPVAVLSHHYWQEGFGANPAVIGQQINLNQKNFTIIGVSQPGFVGALQVGYRADITVPLAFEPMLQGAATAAANDSRPALWWLHLMGRLKPGATLDQARESLGATFQTAALEIMPEPKRDKDVPREKLDPQEYPRLQVRSGSQGAMETRSMSARTIYVLFGVVGLVLLIACANVANLLLARAALRGAEISLRLAVGAGRWRLIRQLLTESVLLSVLGGAVGVVFAFWGNAVLMALAERNVDFLPTNLELQINWRVLAFTFGVSLLTGIVFGLVPAWRATNQDLNSALKQGTRTGSPVSRLSKGLIVAQVALSLVLLLGAGLFIRTLRNLQHVNVGFNQQNLLLFALAPQKNGYKGERLQQFYDQLFARLDNLPGVRSATFGTVPLIAYNTWNTPILFPGERKHPDADRVTNVQKTRENYFSTMEIPLLRGRGFTTQDTANAPFVGVVNQEFGRKFFPNEDVLGKRIIDDDNGHTIEIVGVVADTKYNSQREEIEPLLFTPWRQEIENLGYMYFALRTLGEPTALTNAVRQTVRALDPNLPVTEVKSQLAQSNEILGQERLYARLLSFFGVLALLLAAVGLSGVLAYSVTQRTQEIGIRMALGAQTGNVLRMVIWQGMKLVVLGIALGGVLSYALKRLLESYSADRRSWQHQLLDSLYGVKFTDPTTLIVIALFLSLVALLACWIPARRATKVDPMIALRCE